MSGLIIQRGTPSQYSEAQSNLQQSGSMHLRHVHHLRSIRAFVQNGSGQATEQPPKQKASRIDGSGLQRETLFGKSEPLGQPHLMNMRSQDAHCILCLPLMRGWMMLDAWCLQWLKRLHDYDMGLLYSRIMARAAVCTSLNLRMSICFHQVRING